MFKVGTSTVHMST